MLAQEKEKKFEEIIKVHKDHVYRVCWGFVKNAFDVEDIFQEVMINIWKGLPKFEGKAAMSTWIYRITVNTCLLWTKRKGKSIQKQEFDISKIEVPIENLEPEHNEKILAMKAAIQQLKKIDKTLILLLLEGCTYQEISEITGLTATNVGVKINRIKSKIKKIMTK